LDKFEDEVGTEVFVRVVCPNELVLPASVSATVNWSEIGTEV